MTIEEAKTILKLAKISCVYQHGAYAIALDMAIQALNLNTTCECEKCVIDKITSIKPKQGQWVQIFIPLPLSDGGKDCYCCSECRTHWDYTSNYCPNCGAKMISTSKDVK